MGVTIWTRKRSSEVLSRWLTTAANQRRMEDGWSDQGPCNLVSQLLILARAIR